MVADTLCTNPDTSIEAIRHTITVCVGVVVCVWVGCLVCVGVWGGAYLQGIAWYSGPLQTSECLDYQQPTHNTHDYMQPSLAFTYSEYKDEKPRSYESP